MKPRDIFKLAIRLLGLWFVYLGITNLPMVFETYKALLYVAVDAVAAWWLIGGASLLVNRAYPDATAESQKPTEIPGGVGTKAEAS
jgi:hypothetical protein